MYNLIFTAMRTKWILIILKALIEIVRDSLSEMEKTCDKDCDGIPLSDEYSEQGYLLNTFLCLVEDIESGCIKSHKYSHK